MRRSEQPKRDAPESYGNDMGAGIRVHATREGASQFADTDSNILQQTNTRKTKTGL